MTDNHGQSRHHFPTGRPITDDGRLIYVPWVIAERVGHEFFLDNINLGQITVEEAMSIYKTRSE